MSCTVTPLYSLSRRTLSWLLYDGGKEHTIVVTNCAEQKLASATALFEGSFVLSSVQQSAGLANTKLLTKVLGARCLVGRFAKRGGQR